MKYFKDAFDGLYSLNDDVAPLDSWVAITETEAQAIIQASKPVPTAKDLLVQLYSENALTQRNLRETVMLMAEAFKVVSNNAVDLSRIPGVAKVAEVEAQAQALRAQL